MTIHKFPTFLDRSWPKIEEGLYSRLRKRGVSAEVIEKTVEFAKTKFYEQNEAYPIPKTLSRTPEVEVLKFIEALAHQRVLAFLDMLDLYADTIAAGDGGKKPPESH